MEPIYKIVILTRSALEASLKLQAKVYNDGATATQDVQAESLQGLRVQLVSPNVSGARDLIASGECTIDGATLNVSINAAGLIPGTHRLVVKTEYGTQTVVLYGLDITVPTLFEDGDAQEFEDTITVVSTIGDGDISGADATVYAKDGEGNAHITTPLIIGDGVASGAGAVASGYTYGEGSSIQASSDGAVASGYIDGDNSSIQASGAGAVASGCAYGEGSSIQASSDGAVASGYIDGEGSSIQANSGGAVASGYIDGDNSSIQANSAGAVASGHAGGDNSSIKANSGGAVASGNAGGDNSSIKASGNGAVASGCADGDNSSIQASGAGAVASGYTNSTSGDVLAIGVASQAFGLGVKATKQAQMVCGQCNVVDEDGSFQFIVGNGADDEHRSNAFAVTKSGELALFKADGTPVILTPALLESIIALV
jgi:hypothetical protein